MISNEEFTALSPLERMEAIDRIHGGKALLLSSMQKTSSVLMHLIHRAGSKAAILFVDTQFHFQETLDTRDEFVRRYHLNILTVHPELTPEEQRRRYGAELYLYADGQPQCCEMRKEKPYLMAARKMGIEATISGLMREEGGARKTIPPIGQDKRLECVTYHPIYDWTYEQVDAYLKDNDVPVHPLHAKSYPSIGCSTCTTPVLPGEDRRAGRWRHLRQADGSQPAYCGINFTDLGSNI